MTPPATDRWWPPSLSYSFSSIGRAFFIGRPFPGASLLFCSSSLMPRQDWWEQWEGDRHKSTQRLIEITPRPVSFSSLTESSDFPPFFSFFFFFFVHMYLFCFYYPTKPNMILKWISIPFGILGYVLWSRSLIRIQLIRSTSNWMDGWVRDLLARGNIPIDWFGCCSFFFSFLSLFVFLFDALNKMMYTSQWQRYYRLTRASFEMFSIRFERLA